MRTVALVRELISTSRRNRLLAAMASSPRGKMKRVTPEGPLTQLKMHDGSPVSFGSVRFSGSKQMPAKWAAFSSESRSEDVVSLLCDTWGLPKPPVLISVTGSALPLNEMSSKSKAIFRRGLREAARQTSAWILTGGTNTGVMKMVGAMVSEQDDDVEPPVCLAIAPMGAIYKHEEMLDNADGRIYRYRTPHRLASSCSSSSCCSSSFCPPPRCRFV